MTLDHIENIVMFEQMSDFKNNHSLKVLLEGIFMTYNSMKTIESSLIENGGPSFVFRPTITQNDSQALNLMHWYLPSMPEVRQQ